MRFKTLLSFCFLGALFVSCGGSLESDPALSGDNVVVLHDLSFDPDSLSAAPGDVIYFYNADDEPHRVLSESDNGLFDNSGVFDTGVIPSSDVLAITVPTTAVPGDVIFYYDAFFEDAMITPNGKITIE